MLDTRLFPPDFRGKYPHMFPRDIAVWERFLDKYGELYEGFYYDVICGKEVKMHPNWEDPYRKDAYILSKLRIDAVGEKSNGIDIIEVKPRGTMGSMGQLLTYKEHYTAEWHPTPARAGGRGAATAEKPPPQGGGGGAGPGAATSRFPESGRGPPQIVR